jgi:ATP/maltotriose-dependent transcriptional regulator MalT
LHTYRGLTCRDNQSIAVVDKPAVWITRLRPQCWPNLRQKTAVRAEAKYAASGMGETTMNQLSANAGPLRALTKRRRQVAKLACRGLSNREIAEKLGLIEGTVKVHLHAVYEKLNIHSRTKLAIALMKMATNKSAEHRKRSHAVA